MRAAERQNARRNVGKDIALLIMLTMLFSIIPVTAAPATGKVEVTGSVYEFDKDSHYEFSESDSSAKTEAGNTYGVFSVSGTISDVGTRAGVPAYEVAEGNLEFFYNYGDTLLTADEDSWHLIDDKSKKIDTMKLNSNIMKGAIILQTSKDRKNWIDVDTTTNAFSDTPIRTEAIYSTTDLQLINGCFYRIIVAYELQIRTEESNFLFINTDKHDYKKCVEIYEFYAYKDGGETDTVDLDQTYSLGTKVRTEKFDGYSGEKPIDKKDAHYGWELGNFFVSEYTDNVVGTDGNIVFLKNVGDKVTLWFKLNENIDALNGQENLSITADSEGYDQYFETPKMNFGRGALIIRYTDYNNVKAEPTIYTNYLEANATVGADTKVQLFEEGDYEVALDYEVTNDQLLDTIGHYRIFFKFSVRNGNCMAYPFDVGTGSELTNSAMTETGFRLDLAKSRYLKVNIKREVLKDSADGLVEDIRFNGPAKDGAEYTDEGIYTITVHNEYTNQFTVKKIYVGTNNILRAYMTTGLSIPEINDLVGQGATISDDGTIQLASTTTPAELPDGTEESDSKPESQPDPDSNGAGDKTPGTESPVIVGCIGAVVCIVLILILVLKKRSARPEQEEVNEKGGDER